MIAETSPLPLTILVKLRNGEAADLDHFIDCLHTHLPELAGLRRLGKLTYTPTSRNPLQSNYEVTFVGVQPPYSNEERQSAYIAIAADYLRHAPRPGYEIEDQLLYALDGRTPPPLPQLPRKPLPMPRPTTRTTLLPTPSVVDMGCRKTPEQWDAWREATRLKHNNSNGHGRSLHQELLKVTQQT